MKTALIIVTAGFLAATALGQSDIIIRERAKELRNQNNVRQGVPPPTQPAAAAPTDPGPAAPAQSPALLKLQSDLAAITGSTQVTAAQKQKIAAELLAVAQGAKPSLATATKFAEAVTTAFSEKPLSYTSRARLVQELDAILNPGKYPQAKPDGIFADVQAIFQENGMKRNKAVDIADIVKALSAEVRGGGAK